MNGDIDRYLMRATRGLWGRRKREVKEELATHIEGRVQAHRIGGLGEETAVQRTLEELGQPGQVNGGMLRLHAGPSLAGLGALLILICALTVTLVSSSLAQSLNVIQQLPSRVCLGTVKDAGGDTIVTLCKVYDGILWTTVEALQEVLEPQGIEVVSNLDRLTLTFPGETRPIFLSEKYDFGYPLDTEYADAFQILPGHLLLWDVLDRIAASRDVPLELEGWNNPKVRLGDIAFQLGTPEDVVQGASFYWPYMFKVTEKLFPPTVDSGSLLPSSRYPLGINLRSRQFQFNGTPGEIYGIIVYGTTPIAPCVILPVGDSYCNEQPTSNTGFVSDVAPAAQDGSATFQLPIPNSEPNYVSQFSFQPRAGETVLVHLTGEVDKNGYGYEIVPPEQVKLER